MKLTVKLVGTLGKKYLSNPSQGNVTQIEMENGATVAQMIQSLGLPDHQSFILSVNDEIVPKLERESKCLQESDNIKIIPPLKGG